MDKLTIEHLAPYLPYGVLCEYTIGLTACVNREVVTCETLKGAMKQTNLKIVLRPLSDLTKEIEHNGEFVPIDWLHNHEDTTSDSEWIEHVSGLLHKPTEINFESGPYWMIQQLISWHFDVFGLIDKNLAIDINTLKP